MTPRDPTSPAPPPPVKREIEFLPLKTFVFDTPAEAMESAAREMANWIRTKKYQRGDACLGLTTGGHLEGFYEKLIQMSGIEDKGGLPISGVRTFTVAEQFGLGPQDPRSLRHWIESRLFARWGARAENQHFLRGDLAAGEVDGAAQEYETRLKALGPDLVLVGLGANGRLGINEPGSEATSRTRRVSLSPSSRAELAAEHGFPAFEEQALGLGLSTLRGVKRVRVYAFGSDKAAAVERAMRPEFDPQHPLSVMAGHKDFQLLLDPAAAAALE